MQKKTITILLLMVGGLLAGLAAWSRYHVKLREANGPLQKVGPGPTSGPALEQANRDAQKSLIDFLARQHAESKPATTPSNPAQTN